MSDPFAETDHRPWPLPQRPWVMAQTWETLLFVHWPVALDLLRPLVPEPLVLEEREGTAWVSITPFAVRGLRARGLPALPGLRSFPELNVRTYVTYDDRPGVYFFSLDAGNWAAVAGARALYHLPYFRAAMRLRGFPAGAFHYSSRRTHHGAAPAQFRARYRPAGMIRHSAPGTLDHFLVERYCLYATTAQGRLYRTEIHHQPWPLQGADAAIYRNTMAEAAGIALPPRPARLAFARRLDVAIWLPERLA